MKIAVHAHMHYADLMEQIAGYLRNISLPFDLLVTITDPDARELISSVAAYHLPGAPLTILTVPNKGRDVKPLYTDIAPLLSGYDIIAHIHGKKSAFNKGATAGWLEHLLGPSWAARPSWKRSSTSSCQTRVRASSIPPSLISCPIGPVPGCPIVAGRPGYSKD